MNEENLKEDTLVKVCIEHLSFKSNGVYMDAVIHDGYIDLTIGDLENQKFSVTLEDWAVINEHIVKLLKQDW